MLTDEQIDGLADKHISSLKDAPYFAWYDYARAIEAAATAPLLERIAALTAQVEAAQPVAWMNDEGDVELSHKAWMSSVWKPLFTAPPKAVPLTDWKIADMCGDANRGYDIDLDEYTKAVRDTEQAHGIGTPATVEKEGE